MQIARHLRWPPAAPPPPALQLTRRARARRARARRRPAGRARLLAAPRPARRLWQRSGLPAFFFLDFFEGPAVALRELIAPDELIAMAMWPLTSGIAVVVERLLPFASGRHQGGATQAGLQVKVNRVLQQQNEDGEVAVERRWP